MRTRGSLPPIPAELIAAAKPIPGYRTLFATKDGQILSNHLGAWRILNQKPLNGVECYLCVGVAKRGKGTVETVHRLVCSAFHGTAPPGRNCVRHLDGDSRNNHADNLTWGTPAENMADSLRHGVIPVGEQCSWAKLTEADVREIRRLRELKVPSARIAAMFGVSHDLPRLIGLRQRWKQLV